MSLLNDALRNAEGRREAPATSAVYTGERRAFAATPAKNQWFRVGLVLAVAALAALSWVLWQPGTPVIAVGDAMPVERAFADEPAPTIRRPQEMPGTREVASGPLPEQRLPQRPDHTKPEQRQLTAVPITPVMAGGAEQIGEQGIELRASSIKPTVLNHNLGNGAANAAPEKQRANATHDNKRVSAQRREPREANSRDNAPVEMASGDSDGATEDSGVQASSASVVKQTRMTPGVRDQNTADAMRQALAHGDVAGARRQLDQITAVQEAPRSRSRWARYQLVSGQPQQALVVLSPDLTDADANLRLLRARAQLALGDRATAIQTLQSRMPDAASAPAYISTLATLLQQAGNYPAATEHWAALIAEDDQRGAWWVGLAITLEHQQRRESARRAYTQALALPDLKPSLNDFVRQRLQALGSNQNHG